MSSLGLGRRWARALAGLLLGVATALAALGAAAQDAATASVTASATAAVSLQPVPVLRGHVMDETGTLAAHDVAALDAQLVAFERERGAQVVALVVQTTGAQDIADYSQRVAEAWKLGRAGVGDGVLVVVALQDRRVRIAPYKALEGAIPDVLAKRIIDQHMVPAFKRGDTAGGLRAGLAQVQAWVAGEAMAPPAPTGAAAAAQAQGLDWVDALVLLLVAVPVLTRVLRQMMGQRLGAAASALASAAVVWQLTQHVVLALGAAALGFGVALLGPALAAAHVPTGGRRGGRWSDGAAGRWGGGDGGFSSGGGFGGGFSSGGGGDAGGGGASGSW